MRNLRTTIAGVVLAAIVAVQPLISTGEIDWKQVLIAGAIAALGALAHDPKRRRV